MANRMAFGHDKAMFSIFSIEDKGVSCPLKDNHLEVCCQQIGHLCPARNGRDALRLNCSLTKSGQVYNLMFFLKD